MTSTTSETDALIARLKNGDQEALAELFSQYQAALRRMIDFRLDPRLNGRVSASDVLQETYLDALQRVPHFFKHPEMPFFVWLRLIAGQRLVDVHRQHLGAKMRNAGQEISLNREAVREPAPPAWPLTWSAISRLPARPSSGSNCSAKWKMPSTAWTRSTARYCRCGTSRS